jgi:pimeloyl-ACP methyl ester carboxylesterase
MSLNATIFPELDMPTVAPDLSALDLGSNGVTSELRRDGFGVYVRLVEKELRSAACWENARRLVIAHSFGGMLALHWLLENHDEQLARIDGLILIATTPGPMYQRVRLRVPNPWNSEWRVGLGWLVPLWNLPMTTMTVKHLLCRGQLDADLVNFRALRIRSDGELGRAGWRNTDWRAMRAYRFTMSGFDVRERLGEITVPTIVLHGTEDSLFELDDARRLCRLVPNAELRLVHGAGHSLPVTHGMAVVRAVNDLLGS